MKSIVKKKKIEIPYGGAMAWNDDGELVDPNDLGTDGWPKMKKLVTASAPGKILWLGGYSVLEKGNASFVCAVDKRVKATLKHSKGKIVLSSPQYSFEVACSFDKQKGKLILEQPVPAARFVAKAVEVALCYLSAKKVAIENFSLSTFGDSEFGVGGGKSGLGSSAAATVACVAGVLAFHGIAPRGKNEILVHNLSQISHSLAQGKVGSGFDIAAACFGSCEYSRYSPQLISNLGESPIPKQIAELVDSKWDYSIEKIALPPSLRIVLANVVASSASTTEMVKKVSEWKKNSPNDYALIVKSLNDSNKEAIAALKKGELEKFKDNFESGWQLTVELGCASGAQICPPLLGELLAESSRHGAFVAKLPGAGGGDSVAAICLSEKEEKQLKSFWKSYKQVKLGILPVQASATGVVLE